MLHVAEVGERRRTRRTDHPAVVARLAFRGGRQQVIPRRRTRSGSGVAIGTLPLEL